MRYVKCRFCISVVYISVKRMKGFSNRKHFENAPEFFYTYVTRSMLFLNFALLEILFPIPFVYACYVDKKCNLEILKKNMH